MENTHESLANGKDILTDRVTALDNLINYLARYRTTLQVMSLTHKHMASLDTQDHKELKEIVSSILPTLDIKFIKEWTE